MPFLQRARGGHHPLVLPFAEIVVNKLLGQIIVIIVCESYST